MTTTQLASRSTWTSQLLRNDTDQRKQAGLAIAAMIVEAIAFTSDWYWALLAYFVIGSAIECVKNFDNNRKLGEYGLLWGIRLIASFTRHNIHF